MAPNVWERKRTGQYIQTEFVDIRISGQGLHSNVDILNITELNTLKVAKMLGFAYLKIDNHHALKWKHLKERWQE